MTMKLPAAVPSHAHPRWTAASACTPVGQCMGEGAPLPAKAESCVETTCHHAPSRPSPRSTARGPAAVAALCHAAAVAVACKPEDLPDDQDLNHRLLHHSRPLFERLAVSIELAQPCRERITENGVVKEVHVIVKNVPFSIHVRLPAANEPASEDPAGAGVVDLRDADIEANLRYDGDGGRAVPFVQRAPLEIVASRVADDGQSAVLTARVRALSSQHQNRLFVVHVRIQVPSPGASSGHPPELMTQQHHHHHHHQQLTGLPVREALTEPVQVISKPRSSRKRVVRRKRTLGDMLLECTQRIERTQMSHLGAIGTLTKRCRLIPRGAAAGDAGGQAPAAARPVPSRLSYPAPSSSSSSSSSSSASSLAFPGGVTSSSSSSSSSFSSYADVGTAAFSASSSSSSSSTSSSSAEVEVKQPDDPSWFFLAEGGTPLPEDPQLMMLMDLPAVALPTSSSMYSASSGIGSDLPADVPSTTTTTASTPGGMQMYAVPPASTAQSSSAGAEVEPLLEDQRQHQQHQHQHQHQHGEEDPMGRALIAFLTAYSALPTTDRSMAVRRALRRFGTDRLPALASLLAVVASRPRPKRPAEGAASFQSCVCTSCSFEAELQNIDGFYKDLINLEFSFQ